MAPFFCSPSSPMRMPGPHWHIPHPREAVLGEWQQLVPSPTNVSGRARIPIHISKPQSHTAGYKCLWGHFQMIMKVRLCFQLLRSASLTLRCLIYKLGLITPTHRVVVNIESDNTCVLSIQHFFLELRRLIKPESYYFYSIWGVKRNEWVSWNVHIFFSIIQCRDKSMISGNWKEVLQIFNLNLTNL